MPSDLFCLNSLDLSIFKLRDIWLFSVLPCDIKIPVFNANNADPDQTPRSAASDQGLHCLPMSFLWNAA